MDTSSSFGPDQARARVEQWAAGAPFLAGAAIARVPELDAGGLLAFSVMPRLTRAAGEIIQWVGPAEMLTSGSESDFTRLMARLDLARLDGHAFARLFLRMRALRRAVVLDRPDGHILLEPGQLPAGQFSPPRADVEAGGMRFRFWAFDLDRLEPAFWDVRVALNGVTTFASG